MSTQTESQPKFNPMVGHNPLDYEKLAQAEYNDFLAQTSEPLTDRDLVLMQHQYLQDLPQDEFDNLDDFSQVEFSFYELRPAERDLAIDNFMIELEENAYIDEEHALDHLYATYLHNPYAVFSLTYDDLNFDKEVEFLEASDRSEIIDNYLKTLFSNRFYSGGAYSGDSYDREDRDKLFVYARHLAHHSIVPTAFNRGVTA